MARLHTRRDMWRWVRRYRSRRVLGVWAALTVVIAGYVYASVVFFDLLAPRMKPRFGLVITPVSLGVLGVLLGAVCWRGGHATCSRRSVRHS